MRYKLDIIRNANKSLIQTISVRNGVDPSVPGGLEIIDINQDGYGDLRLRGGETAKSAWYKIWYFDPKSEQFVWSHTTHPTDPRDDSDLVPSAGVAKVASSIIIKRSDNPWIWDGVRQVLTNAGIDHEIIKIETRPEYSILTVAVYFNEPSHPNTVSLIHFDGNKWFLRTE